MEPRMHGSRRRIARPKATRWRLAVWMLLLATIWLGSRALTNPTWAQAPARNDVREPSPVDDLDGPKPQAEAKNAASDNSKTAAGKKADKFKGIPTTPTEIVDEMGLWMLPFALSSVLAVWFSIERMVVLRRRRVIPKAFVDRLLLNVEQGKLDPEQALKLCEENESPTAQVFAHAIRKWGKPSVEIEQAIIDGGDRAIGSLRTHLRALSFIASVNPLIGLYGTVVGMILAFNDIAQAGSMGRTDQLATGIGVALLTTAFGLSIAIPTQTMHTLFVAKIDGLVAEIDELAQTLSNLICAEALSGSIAQAARPKLVRRDAPAAVPKKAAAAE